MSNGTQLRVDVELAHAARDQLRGLAAEVEDDDAVGRLGLVVRRPVGRRRVERYLEICLDLGIVRRKHAMAGVGRLAVDGLAAL